MHMHTPPPQYPYPPNAWWLRGVGPRNGTVAAARALYGTAQGVTPRARWQHAYHTARCRRHTVGQWLAGHHAFTGQQGQLWRLYGPYVNAAQAGQWHGAPTHCQHGY